MLFSDFDNIWRNAVDVETCKWIPEAQRRDKSMLYEVTLRGDYVCYVSDFGFQQILSSSSQFVSANSGIFELEIFDREIAGEVELVQRPVLAWRISQGAKLMPVTPQGVSENEFWSILLPDGQVASVDGRMYPSKELFLQQNHS